MPQGNGGADEDARRRAQVAAEGTPVFVERRRLTLKTVLGWMGTVLLIVLLPLLFTVAVGIFQTLHPEKIVTAGTPADHGLSFEDVTITTADGIDLAAWYVPAKSPTDVAVLVLHGYPADKGDVLPRSAFLAERFDLLYIDFRWLGRSGGSYTTGGPREIADAEAALKYLRAKGKKTVGIYGFSMGGTVSLMTLDKPWRPDAVVAEAAYADLRSMMEEQYRYLGPFRGICGALTELFSRYVLGIDLAASSPAVTARGSTVPVLVIHSRDDRVVPFRHAELMQEALKGSPSAEFWFLEGVGHGEPAPEFAERVRDFFDRNLAR